MAARFFLVLCASALLVQSIAACGCGCGNGWNNGASLAGAIAGAEIASAGILGAEIAAANNYGNWGYSAPAFAPSAIYSGPAIASANGGYFGVSVASPFAPSGINVVSENSIDGALEVIGSLPVLATVAVEGSLASSGSAGTSYSCGSGDVGISTGSLTASGLGAGSSIANQVARAEIAGASLANSAGYGAAAANLGAAYAGAELAGINAGLAGSRYARPACSCY